MLYNKYQNFKYTKQRFYPFNRRSYLFLSPDLHIPQGTEVQREQATEDSEGVQFYELVESLPVDEMHAASSSEKHMSTEKTSSEGGAESQLLTKMSSMITESSTTHTTTKKEYISSTMSSTLLKSGEEPSSVCTKTVVQSMEQASSENGGIPVVQSQKVEEYEKIMQDQPGEIRQEKTVIVSHDQEGAKSDSKLTQLQKPSRKFTAPRFVTPITGMIVDQGTDIVLEGMIDGYPQPTIIWSKNGQELKSTDFKTSYAHNHVRLELKNVNVKDAGRYTCTANNEVGSASSTADLVVKKTIFPPVFGRRLQAQVVKRGDRVIMEVEITGMPEPTVLWYKDDIPIKERPPEQRIKQQGNCYTLIIEKAEKEHVGKYMVRATNAGGEAQSIADFAVFEPTPDTMVEVHKTRVYENIQDKKTVQPGVQMEHVPFVNLKTERISTTMIEPSPIAKTIPTSSMSTSTVFGVQKSNEPEMHSYRSEKISSTVESSQIETKSEQKFHMKLEHRTPPIMETKSMQDQSSTVRQILPEDTIVKLPESKDKTFDEKIMTANENVETSTIARKDALSFFESMTRESENLSKGPKEMIRLVDDSDGQAQEMKVGKLTKNYERSTTYQEVKKPETKPQCDFQATKKAVQEIFTKLEQGPSPRGVDNKLFNFPCESYKPSPAESKRTEEATSYRSTMSKSAFESVDTSFNLVPEPPPEIGYMAKPEEAKKKRPEVSIKAKQLQESFEKTLSPIEAPIGGVKIFPSPKVPETTKIYTPSFSIPAPPFELERKEVVEETCIKKDAREKRDSKYLKEEKIRPLSPIRPWSSSSDMETRSHVSTDLSEYRCHSAASSHQEALRATSPRPSADGLAMEKSWAKKCPDSTRKSWPPPAESANTLKEWMVPGEDYKSSASEFKQNIEETEDRFKKTTMESSDSLEKRSWSNKMTMEKIVERPPSPPKFGPIIYNAETIKVDHTVNKIQQQSLLEKYTKEYELQKTSNKMQEQSSKDRWTGCGDLKAPSLVRNFEPPKKPTPQAYQPVPKDEIILESGPPPEFGYIPPPVSMETKIEKSKERESVRTSFRPVAPPKKEDAPMLPPKDVRITPPPLPVKQQTSLETRESFKSSVIKPTKLPPSPTPTKFVKGSFGHESDYESDFDGHLRAKWRPYESDNEEPRYRRVKPPVTKQSTRPRSTEPEPLPPSRFEVPPSSSITVQPTLLQEHGDKICKKTVIKRHEKEFKQQMGPAAPVILEPGSPPIYVQPAPKSPTGKKSDSPKFKVKSFQQESGYMADTDEPFQQKLSSMSVQKTIGKHEESCHMESKISYAETRSELIESKSYEQRKKESGLVSGVQKPTIQQQHSSSVEKSCISTAGPSQFNHAKEIFHSMDQSQKKFETTRKILPSSQSPSKFVKSEFRESDYESDYDGRIPSLWKPRSSESDKQAFRPVKSGLIGSG
ncbi:hypothetical protein KM043_013359 [Ampulex compressa]|nr:hypothetical protein KM043_013359 [Ampulex compressa]